MNDDDFLTQTVSATRLLVEATTKQMISIKACDLTYRYCSPYLLTLMGVPEANIQGQTICLSMYDNDISFDEILRAEDQLIIKSRTAKTALKINRFTTGLTPYICNKSPLINPATDHVIGILFQAFETGIVSLHHHVIKTVSTYTKNKDNKDTARPHLSKREKQVIYLFMTHLSSQEIADMLHQMEGKKISKSTIDSLFSEQLYPKFNVYSRPALYKKLQSLGYETMIPKEVLRSSSVLPNTINIY